MWHQQIEQHGYAVIPNVLNAAEVSSIIEELSTATISRTRAGARHLLRIPAIASLTKDRRLLEIAREILGDNALPFRATLFDKSPEANWLIVWHQDTALPLQERHDVNGWGPWSVKSGVTYAHAPAHALNRVLALRIHLDDSTIENGPLRVLPCTHKMGVLTDEQVEELAGKVKAIDCVTERHGIIAMRPLVVHASSKSVASVARRVIHIEYAKSQEIGDGLQLAIA